MKVVSPHLSAAGAVWDDGSEVGRWIAGRLGPFGPRVDHAVPVGYPSYAVVSISWDGHPEGDRGPLMAVAALIDVLSPLTGDQRVHCGMWDGWGWWYDTGTDPRENSGAGVYWLEGELPSQQEQDSALAEARELIAEERVERPDTPPLELPHRGYHVWTGPLRSAVAFAHQPTEPPSLIWPEDRSWFVGAPIYTNEIAVAGPENVIAAALSDARLSARPARPTDELDIED